MKRVKLFCYRDSCFGTVYLFRPIHKICKSSLHWSSTLRSLLEETTVFIYILTLTRKICGKLSKKVQTLALFKY